MQINLKKITKTTLISLISLTILSLIIKFIANIAYLESFRIIFGSVYVLFLPGLIISYIFFPSTKEFDKKEEESDNSIDIIERIALSFALSIAVVPLVIFYLNLVGLKINLINSSLSILGIIIISLIILKYKKS
jgi:uncharacterized membrane protein